MKLWLLAPPLVLAAGVLYWRYVWFFRNPPRIPPPGENIVSPADGTVVYVSKVEPHQEVIMIKQGFAARLTDIVREDLDQPKISIGIFMSPFNVHYNRIPLAGRIASIQHHPAIPQNLPMSPMHWRTMLHWPPFYQHSRHIIQNERTVTRMESTFRGEQISYYVVQIAGWSVAGIDSYFEAGEEDQQGQNLRHDPHRLPGGFGLPYRPEMDVMVRPGDKVRAGETVLVA